MAIGERIHFFRKMHKMTLKKLGQAVGFPEQSADVRMAQYESGTRTPKSAVTNRLAEIFDVSPQALAVPDIDSYTGLMHTLFALEDIYGLKIAEIDGNVCLYIDKPFNTDQIHLSKMLCAWQEQAAKLADGEIDRETYDRWRYHYPEYDTTQMWAKVLPQELSDLILENMRKN